MIHPHTELRKIDDHIGYGVFATRPIPRGTVTWALDPLDLVITAERAADPRYASLLDHYAFTDYRGRRVLCWDFARYMNHSCEPSCVGPGGTDFDLAIRDIAAGEELTYDYGTLNIGEVLECRCASPRCRGQVSAADLEARAPILDAQLRASVIASVTAPQPLAPWLTDADRLRAWAAAPETLPSSTAHRPPS